MFYSQDILQRRGGKFGIIWIAATKATHLTKRDYCAINIKKTCEDLLAYIMLQANPLHPGAPRPRFSLYLSSQLMYGVVQIYHKQQQYLFYDANSLSTRFHVIAAPLLGIDLKDVYRPDHVTMTDVVDTLCGPGHFPAEDPCFGLLKSIDLVDWELIPDVAVWQPLKLELSPDYNQKDILVPSSPRTPEIPFRPVFGSPLQVRPEVITMLEEPLEGVDELRFPGEQDLPPLTEDGFHELVEEKQLILAQEEIETRTDQMTSPPSDKQTDIQSDEMIEEQSVGQQLDEGRLPAAEETPMDFPEIDLDDQPPAVHRSPRRKRRASMLDIGLPSIEVIPPTPVRLRRRQLFVLDSEIQIPRKQIREQMQTSDHLCKPFEPAGEVMTNAKQLLSLPTKKEFRHRRLLHLWKRNAFSSDFPETDSDQGHPVWAVPDYLLSVDGSSSSDRETVRDLPLTIGEPPLSPVLEVAEEQRDESHLRDTVELGHSTLEQSHGERFKTPQDMHLSSIILSKEDLTSSFAKESGRRPASRRLRMSADLDRSGEEKTLTEEPEIRLAEDLATVQEVAEEQIVSPAHDDLQTASFLISAVGSPSKKRKIVIEEEMKERLLSPAHRSLISRITAQTETDSYTLFEHVCPYTDHRQLAARKFTALLNFAAVQKISVHQDRPYGNIFIKRGLFWNE